LKFFFDNNLSPHLAHAIGELSKRHPEVERVIHLSDEFSRNAPDTEWLAALEKDGPWYIVSVDRLNKQHGAEREAIRRAGHTVFVLDRQWSKQLYWLQAERLVRWWPQIINQAALVTGQSFNVPWQHSTKAKFTGIKR
jgi:hypothetical protein